MSKFLDHFRYFKEVEDSFSDDHGKNYKANQDWEDGYRTRWQHDKVVRSTHGVNCTGSCSWKVFVKKGLVTWETQFTDYPETPPGMPNHEPRGCARGASYSWYLYSANRVKYPMIRAALLSLWHEAKLQKSDPVEAWGHIVRQTEKMTQYKALRGQGGLVRVTWAEVIEIIAAANIHTIKTEGPDRIVGFSPIPAMSMVSYAAGTRYLSLIGGTSLSFYDWYCDLPPSSPMTWGEQTDVPESADWFNSSYIITWGSNVPQTRTPDAHFFTEVRYKGTKTVAVTPDYAEVVKLSDQWLKPKQGTDAALALAMGHVVLIEFHVKRKSSYFQHYLSRYTDMPILVMLDKDSHECFVPGRFLRASDLPKNLGETNNPEWKTVAFNHLGELETTRSSIGFRWEKNGTWNLKPNKEKGEYDAKLYRLGIKNSEHLLTVAFPYFGDNDGLFPADTSKNNQIIHHKLPAQRVTLANGCSAWVTCVYDLVLANYGIDRGFNDLNCSSSYDDNKPFTPVWAEKITGVPKADIIRVAKEFGGNAEQTHGRSMIIMGAGINHWYHMDMTYRGLINILIFCGCIGRNGGGWAHYVGQEKLRPLAGWIPLAFASDWTESPRQMNATSFFYAHSSQWRYEMLDAHQLLSPLASSKNYSSHFIDWNVKAERLGWLPSSPQLNINPLRIAHKARSIGTTPYHYTIRALEKGHIRFASEQPEKHYPKNMFLWRSNLLGASGKGHEYLLKYLLGTKHGIQGGDIGQQQNAKKPLDVEWEKVATEGKLDLVVTLDFRMSSTCLYSDIILPTATWYEKDDLSTSDMHSFIHPFSAAVNPGWDSKTDWEIFKLLSKSFSSLCNGHLSTETDIVLQPILHDTPYEMGQAYDVKDWKKGECQFVPGKTAPHVITVKRDYPTTYQRFTSLGPRVDKEGVGCKGLYWNVNYEIEQLRTLNTIKDVGQHINRPKIDTAQDAANVILTLSPETNGGVALKAWQSLSDITGVNHSARIIGKEHTQIRFQDLQRRPEKVLTSPIWSGVEDDRITYTANFINIHEYVPWRTLTGRQQLYQDHLWMRVFGESLATYRPAIDTKSTTSNHFSLKSNGNKQKTFSFITPHQKWGIHSTYSDNLTMLTLSRGGPTLWISEADADDMNIKDNDWLEAFNSNGALIARAIVSQRIPLGMVMMYHAQDRVLNIPLSEVTTLRGGIHNSVTRVCLKPTHMIGGYAHQSYGFNYYGTVGSNRDEFVIVRKMQHIKWLTGHQDDE